MPPGPMTGLPTEDVNVLVIGSGAGGLAAAITAAHGVEKVMVVEKADRFGGTTAWSGGWMWIPGSPLVHPIGSPEQEAEVNRARGYLTEQMGDDFGPQRPKIEAYLESGPRMLAFFMGRSGETTTFRPLEFDLDRDTPDFHPSPFAQTGGRAVRARAIKSSRLGCDGHRLREPLPELTLFGMGIEAGAGLADVLRMLRWHRSAPLAFLRVMWRGLWHFVLRLPPRVAAGHCLVNGNALAARLLLAAREAGVDLRASTTAYRLTTDAQGGVTGAHIGSADGLVHVRASQGVVLACGGFPHDAERLRELMPDARTGLEYPSAAPRGNRGDGLRLGKSVGAFVRPIPAQPVDRATRRFDPKRAAPAMWAPVSLLRRRDGTTAIYPHLVERAKPGVIAVDRAGKRFCNEAAPYHDFVAAWLQATPHDAPLEAWLVCDRDFLRRYGLGAVKPALPWRLQIQPWRSGYLQHASTLEGLALACGMDAAALRHTVETHNADARSPSGTDTQFRRGESEYDKSQGDPLRPLRPCMAPIESAPFFAVRLQPGTLGTFAGLETDASGRVQKMDDGTPMPIPSLHACGNDMAAPLGGFYPSSGFTLGAAMTFGWLIGRALWPLAAPAAAADPPTAPADAGASVS